MSSSNDYSECALPRPPPVFPPVNEDIAEAIGRDFRVMPLFEKSFYEYNYKKYYSLNTNEFLKCRWRSYVKHFEERTFSPFEFVDIRDFHFCNSRNRLLPTESVHKKTDFRFKLGVGPGVDFRGQMPIPQDLLMKRGTKPIPKPRKYSKPKPEKNYEQQKNKNQAKNNKYSG